MGKRRSYERLSAAVLAAILAANYGGANISARADMVSAVEERIQAEAKGLTASPSDAENKNIEKTEKEKNTEKKQNTEKTKKTNTKKEKFRSQDRNALRSRSCNAL